MLFLCLIFVDQFFNYRMDTVIIAKRMTLYSLFVFILQVN